MIDQAFPKEIRAGKPNESNMKVELANGSVWQVVGSDNYDSLVGTNPVGIVLSEYAIGDPSAWDYFRPILRENGGWAVFIYTPRGKTHGYSLYQMAKEHPAWYSSLLTIDDTGIMSREDMEDEILQGMSREKAMQEFLCSFDVGMEGAFYTEELEWADRMGHVGNFPWNPDKSVQTWWDIGIRDNTSVVFTQEGEDGNPIIIDHMSRRNIGLPTWVKILNDLPYAFDQHRGPHDIATREWGTEVTRQERGHGLGIEFDNRPEDIKVVLQDGIDASRAMLRKVKFNKDTTQQLRDNLAYYHREWDDNRQIFSDRPNHDHSSHDADAFRELATHWTTRSTGRILIKDERTGLYRPNIEVKRAYGGARRKSHQRSDIWTPK
jgi:hypothetical protein